jgi:hypothetical protein
MCIYRKLYLDNSDETLFDMRSALIVKDESHGSPSRAHTAIATQHTMSAYRLKQYTYAARIADMRTCHVCARVFATDAALDAHMKVRGLAHVYTHTNVSAGHAHEANSTQ